MSLHPLPIFEVPEETARIAQAAFPKGNLYMRIRDKVGAFSQMSSLRLYFQNGDSQHLVPGVWPSSPSCNL